MQAMFNDLSALGNVTTPGVLRPGNEPHTGGSLMTIAPRAAPSAGLRPVAQPAAGCGGIDIYWRRVLLHQQSSSSSRCCRTSAPTPGYACAGTAVDPRPTSTKLLTELQDQINKINSMNINSLRRRRRFVTAWWASIYNSMMSGCANISQYLGSVTDRVEAPAHSGATARPFAEDRRQSARPQRRNTTFQGNVIWMALNQVSGSIM